VTGLIDPDRVLTNAGARQGDHLILTKPIGTVVITTALKQGKAEPAWVAEAIRSMTMLNRRAAEACLAPALQASPRSCCGKRKPLRLACDETEPTGD
jgi:selenide,water dikinase